MSLTEMNIELFRMVNNLGKDFTFLNPVMKFIAEYMVILLAIGILFYWFNGRKNNRMMVICGGITFILAEIIGKIAGKIHSNNQPFAELANVNQLIGHAVDNSFPSDHTILFFSFCVSFFLFKRGSGLIWMLIACLVGVSRIWVGVHYPGDVIAGATISIIAALIINQLIPKLSIVKRLLAIYEKIEQRFLPEKMKTKDTEF